LRIRKIRVLIKIKTLDVSSIRKCIMSTYYNFIFTLVLLYYIGLKIILILLY